QAGTGGVAHDLAYVRNVSQPNQDLATVLPAAIGEGAKWHRGVGNSRPQDGAHGVRHVPQSNRVRWSTSDLECLTTTIESFEWRKRVGERVPGSADQRRPTDARWPHHPLFADAPQAPFAQRLTPLVAPVMT